MSKFKDFWRKNKVLVVLVGILVICFVAICIVVATYFFGGSETVYGDRLKDIDKHPITEELKNEYINSLKEDEKAVQDITFNSKGRVIYIRIKFVDDYALKDAESKAIASLAKLTDNILEYYDLNFTLVADKTENSDGFTIMGAKNTGSENIVWNNNTKIEKESEEK